MSRSGVLCNSWLRNKCLISRVEYNDSAEYFMGEQTEELMRDSRTRILTFCIITLILCLLSSSTFAQVTDTRTIWSTYHSDTARGGQNNASADITDPGLLNLIWVSPRGDGSQTSAPEESKMIVDNKGATASGWTRASDPEAWESGYLNIAIRNKDKAANLEPPYLGVTAEWKFPDADLPDGYYQIYIWVPSSPSIPTEPQNTSQAEYTVSDDFGMVTIKFDQRDGGYWKLLSTRQFYFTGSTSLNCIRLSNLTDDTSPDPADPINNNIRVVADAVKFVPATGMEIYSSPASAMIPWSHAWTDSSLVAHTWTGTVPAVYVGTVENPLTNSNDSPDTGAIYCINSVTTSVGVPTSEEELELANQLGTNIWRYPNNNLTLRHELEGPIEGGVYSSPTLAYVDLGTSTTPDVQLVSYVAANDRQVYALDAITGSLIWKGPGMTVSESGGLTGTWIDVNNRADAFGGKFRVAQCATDIADQRTATWSFPDLERQGAGEPLGGGWSYTVYAWIPAMMAVDVVRAKIATYTVSFITPRGTETEKISVDQSDIDNQGKWVSLGDFFNVKQVTLTNIPAATVPVIPVIPGSHVVADAMMIVPAAVGSFEKCSPVVDVESPNGAYSSTTLSAHHVYVVSSDGRALSFTAPRTGAITNKKAEVNWIYPRIRSAINVVNPDDSDQPSMGEIGASPAYCDLGSGGKNLYIASGDGKVRCIDALDPTVETNSWIFTDTDKNKNTGSFTSTPAIDKINNQLFIGSTEGVFYCLHLGKQSGGTQLKAKNPKDWGDDDDYDDGVYEMPFGAFRFSTAAISEDRDNDRRVWVGSADGHVYSFGASPGALFMKRLRVKFGDDGIESGVEGKWFVEPSANAAIQGSIALDSKSKATGPMVMYVGDMKGTLHWFNANTGLTNSGAGDWAYKGWRTGSELFSSPNVTDIMVGPPGSEVAVSYIYVGGSDGRIYAFSRDGGAWGGRWAQGSWWPFEGAPNDNSMKETITNFDSNIQFDIFPSTFSDHSDQYDIERTFTIPGDPNIYHTPPSEYSPLLWPDDTAANTAIIVSQDMKMPPGLVNDVNSDDEKETELLRQAKLRRKHVAFKSTRQLGASQPDSTLYLEWGEKINVILWNLPPKSLIQGTSDSSKRNAITFNMVNSSPGASAGNLVKGIHPKILKEYTVLDSTPKTMPGPGPNPITYNYRDPLTIGGTEVKRCFAIAELPITSNQQTVLSPGPGWVLKVDVKAKASSASTSYTTETIPLAKLKPDSSPNSLEPVIAVDSAVPANRIKYIEQSLGINNPLAIKDDDATTPLKIAWPPDTNLMNFYTDRNDPEAHFNGNTIMPGGGGYDVGIIPKLDMRAVAHGTSSRLAKLGVMDRSATGCKIIDAGKTPPITDALQRFRINAGDLRWATTTDSAISAAGGIKLPWELGLGSADYPNLYKRHQDYRKTSDDANPSKQPTTLPAIVLKKDSSDNWVKEYDGLPGDPTTKPSMRPDFVAVSVDVPKYQPASEGYTRTMEAYIDSNGNNSYESGNGMVGRPTTRQEVYRRFKIDLAVRPDPKIEVEEQTIDIGRAPHGLGEFVIGQNEFSAFNPNPEVQKWFKKLTIKNAGNVNLANVQIGNNVPLVGDKNSSFSGIFGGQITSSLDGSGAVEEELAAFSREPFTTTTPSGIKYGYTITKPKVGDPDPSVMTIPDRRKWDFNYNNTKSSAAGKLSGTVTPTFPGWPTDNPLDVRVSVRVPISQPVGSYQSWEKNTRSVFVPVFSVMPGGFMPSAAPSFQLRLNVVENQVTGGVSSLAVLPQIDGATLPKVGDDTPAAFRDRLSGNVHLFWSSNRIFDPELPYPNWANPNDPLLTDFANAPWFLNHAWLEWSGTSWNTASDGKWWITPTEDYFIPNFPDGANLATQWPKLMNAAGASVPKWKYGTDDTDYDSVKHHSPVFADNETAPSTAETGLTWLAWIGSADVKDPVSNKITQEQRIFYTDATHGDVTDDAAKIYSIEHDPAMVKLHPSASVFNNDMWMFWQGGESGRWSIFYAINDGETDNDGNVSFPPANWAKDDLRLRTPDCLASVSSPNAIHRQLWTSLASVSPTFAGARHLFDVVYAGTTKFSQTSDIMLSRYTTVTSASNSASPSRRAQPLPRVFDEKLEKDAKYGFYASQHLAWIRLGRRGFEGIPSGVRNTLLGDYIGQQPHMAFEAVVNPMFIGSPSTLDPTNLDLFNLYNLPYIWVKLPANYENRGWPAGARISGTTGAITDANGIPLLDSNNQPVALGQPIIPEIDDATGIYTYKYTGVVKEILGDMLVDYSTGVVRFTEPLIGVTSSGTVKLPEIHADYTPQTWRLTTSSAVDNSPRAFIDRTPMNLNVYPGMGNFGDSNTGENYYAPIDRLWTFWRKAGTGVDSSTIFYKTYRIGVDITKLFDNSDQHNPALPIKWIPGPRVAQVTVSGNFGPWEVDRSGRRIYFSEVDERYRSLMKSGSTSALGTLPGPITVTYQNTNGNGETQTVELNDIYWLEELSEQPLFTSSSSVNEGSIYAFADLGVGTGPAPTSSKIWVFWTSTRAGTSDLFWETVSPTFTAW